MRRCSPPALLGALCALLAPASAVAATADQSLRASLAASMRGAGPYSGALVIDLDAGRTLYALRADSLRIPASNEKLYTTATAMLAFGPGGRLATRVYGNGSLDASGTYRGTLYLRGDGDPTFGTYSFTRRAYGAGATVSDLALRLRTAGIRRVTGGVLGDESRFDRRRGGLTFARSFYIGGPLSGLSFNRGLANEYGSALQTRPAAFAAAALVRELRARGVAVAGPVTEGITPPNSSLLADVPSLTIATLAGLTNRPSDNYMAETLLKGIGAHFGAGGSTFAGAAAVRARLGPLGINARVVDGSGLSRANATSPRQVVALLAHMRRTPAVASAFAGSLAVAGRSGTLYARMRGTAASGRCRGKTGTLFGASALSGYCTAIGGRTLGFSILMNRVNVSSARSLQDRMAAAIAAYRLAPVARATAPASR